MLKRMLTNQRGLTLIELLVVVVILGIIVAIAIPTVGNIIENSKLDAHLANAKQMVGAAKMYIAAEPNPVSPVTLETLSNLGYLDRNIRNPHGVTATPNYANTSSVTFDVANGTYTVTLRGTGATGVRNYINNQDPNTIERADVKTNLGVEVTP